MTILSRDYANMEDILRGSDACFEIGGTNTFDPNMAKNGPM